MRAEFKGIVTELRTQLQEGDDFFFLSEGQIVVELEGF